MKNISLFLILLLFAAGSCSRSNPEYNMEIDFLTAKVDSLSALVDTLASQNKFQDDEISWLENQIVELNKSKEIKPAALASKGKPAVQAKLPVVTPAKTVEKAVPDLQCIAITNAGKRCSRPAITGSKYCLQHKQIYEPDK